MTPFSKKRRSLKQTYLFRRLLWLLFSALILWTTFTGLIYNRVTRPIIVNMKARDLMPQAEWIASRIVQSPTKVSTGLLDLVNTSYHFFKTWTYLCFDYEDVQTQVLKTPLPDYFSTETSEAVQEKVFDLHRRSLEGETHAVEIAHFPNLQGDLLFVSAPIYLDTATTILLDSDSPDPQPIGTVVMLQPMSELETSVYSLNYSLLLSALLSAILLIFPTVWITRRFVRPLSQLRKVALSISDGEFSLRAGDQGTDEIADLGRALNNMSDRIASSLRQLELERNQLQEIIDAISEGIVAKDSKGEITLVNDVFWALFGQSPHHISEKMLLADTGVEELFQECIRMGAPIQKTLDLVQDQKRILCQIKPVFDRDGILSTVVGLFRDITESERLEQTRRDYIANVSHELRSPITAMRALLEPLNDGLVTSPSDCHRYYGILLRETMRLSRLIDDMLELSRLQSGKGIIRQTLVDTNTLYEDLSQRFAILAEDHSILFEKIRPEEPLPALWGSVDRIEQILIIYFDNALKFTPENGQITFRISYTDAKIVFAIEDNGPGISPEDLPFVFERFYKADKAHNESGTGLGLSIAKTLAGLLNMDVSASSCVGQGAIFTLGVKTAREQFRSKQEIKDVYDSDPN